MTEAQRTRLQAAFDLLADLRKLGGEPKMIVATLVRDHGARLRTDGPTNALRFGGHAASCTANAGNGLLDNWTNSAGLKLIAAAQGGFGKER